MGTSEPSIAGDGEGPVRRVELGGFLIDRFAVTNARFQSFVNATGYVTEAERFGWSFVFHAFARGAGGRPAPSAPWWRQVHGATWWCPDGPGSSIADRMDHPVVHVSYNDAAALALWEGKRLPTEAEWERAARGGLEGARYPWGDDLHAEGRHHCNIWQGTFPQLDTGDDGYVGTAPVDAFEPNGYGLFNMTGNVWEWCADWFTARHSGEEQRDPRGPEAGPGKVVKGGSYLCHASYCNRYRVAARTLNSTDTSTGNMGFRLAMDTARRN